MACTTIPCGVAVDLADAIRDIIVKDTTGCVGVEGIVDSAPTCKTLTNLVSCGKRVSLKEAFLSALDADGCGRYALKIYDLTER